MAVTPSHRPTREFPLLLLTLGVVGLVCFPLWQALSAGENLIAPWSGWSAERWGRLLIGPEQIACYTCFTWASLILLSRAIEVRRQRKAFDLPLLPTEEGTRILQEDARPLQRQIDQVIARKGPFVLANMIRGALAKFSLSRNSQEVTNAVRAQAEVEQNRMVTGLSMVNYLAWAIPALGFLGTVRGLAGSMTMAAHVGPDAKEMAALGGATLAGAVQIVGHLDAGVTEFIQQATRHLAVAFDCTLIALALSVSLMFLLNLVQRSEEALIIDCQQYCLDHLVNRIYEPEHVHGSENNHSSAGFARERNTQVNFAGNRTERIPQ